MSEDTNNKDGELLEAIGGLNASRKTKENMILESFGKRTETESNPLMRMFDNHIVPDSMIISGAEDAGLLDLDLEELQQRLKDFDLSNLAKKFVEDRGEKLMDGADVESIGDLRLLDEKASEETEAARKRAAILELIKGGIGDVSGADASKIFPYGEE